MSVTFTDTPDEALQATARRSFYLKRVFLSPLLFPASAVFTAARHGQIDSYQTWCPRLPHKDQIPADSWSSLWHIIARRCFNPSEIWLEFCFVVRPLCFQVHVQYVDPKGKCFISRFVLFPIVSRGQNQRKREQNGTNVNQDEPRVFNPSGRVVKRRMDFQTLQDRLVISTVPLMGIVQRIFILLFWLEFQSTNMW